jgi:hypothetical protein
MTPKERGIRGGKDKKLTGALALLVSATVVLPGPEAADRKDPVPRADAIRSVSRMINEYSIVCLGEGGHQAALDDFIMGRDGPYDELCRVWRDTSTSPITPWDSPLYFELLELIRANNGSLAPSKRVRVLGGDPPIEWEQITSREDFRNAPRQRNDCVSKLAKEQAFKLNKKVLIIYGGAHLPGAPVGAPDDIRNSITYRIQRDFPGSVRAIEFLRPEDLRIEDR